MTPSVGIPLCLDACGRIRAGRVYHYIDTRYARAVELVGGLPLYLPMQTDCARLLERVDALLVPGGDDLLPPHPYPESVRFEPAPPEQLEFDRRLLAGALARELPVLGICYGMQLLALHFGAELYYDLATDLPSAGAHRLAEHDGRHPIRVSPGSRLASVLSDAPAAVNSLHHQAVSDPGPALLVSARAADGVIEAIEHPDRFCVGVQWHPEKLADRQGLPLFRALVEAARARGA